MNNQYVLTYIFIYPVKSLGGISLNTAQVEERGLQYDRRWMLVDEANSFITQRTHPQLALLKADIKNGLLTFSHRLNDYPLLSVPLSPRKKEEISVRVWNDSVPALKYEAKVNRWLSDVIGFKTSLVYMPDSTKRTVNSEYAENKIVSFADGYPFLIIGEESLNWLNNLLDTRLPMNRFRPNFVFSGGKHFDEDNWRQFTIANNTFISVKPCSRCVITTINQDTAEKSKEPLQTLSRHREKDGKVLFGVNLISAGCGKISVGDQLKIL